MPGPMTLLSHEIGGTPSAGSEPARRRTWKPSQGSHLSRRAASTSRPIPCATGCHRDDVGAFGDDRRSLLLDGLAAAVSPATGH